MATVAAGLVLGGLAPSRASSAVRELWEQLWDSLDYVANALTRESRTELAYDAAGARRLGARRAREALGFFHGLPNIDGILVRRAQETFGRREEKALHALSELEHDPGDEASSLRHRRSGDLARLSAADALRGLTHQGLLPENLANRASEALSNRIEEDEGS